MRTRRLVILGSLAALAGCHAADPCSGVTGSCISLRVEGSGRVDRLDVATGGQTQSSSSKATELPVQLAVVPPAGASGNLELDVTGFSAGSLVGTGSVSVTVGAGHVSATVTLTSPGGPGGDMGDDMTMTAFDLSGGCVPNSTVCSNGSTLQTCSADGMTLTPTTCAVTCVGTSPAHCAVFVPSAPAMTSDFQTGLADTVLTTGNTYLVNTDNGTISNVRPAGTGTLAQITFRQTAPGTNDPGVGVFSFNSLDIQEGATVQVVGGRALIIAANATIKVTGVIDARAYDQTGMKICNVAGAPGPGGFAGGLTAAGKGAGPGGGFGGSNSGSTNGGGGGASHGGPGGAGGYTVSGATNYGAAGALDFPAAPLPLRGGSGGGGGSSTMGNGGGGGGAVQLVAQTSITIGGGASMLGGIDVGGCGGTNGIMYNSGGGGGAGGMILIESPSVSVLNNGVLAANGGSGGSYGGASAPGTLSAMAAPGSPGSSGYTYGGNGSAAGILGGEAGGFNSTYFGGGGGGGGAGLILINNVSGSLTPAGGAIVSPTLNTKNSAMQVVSAIGTITVQ